MVTNRRENPCNHRVADFSMLHSITGDPYTVKWMDIFYLVNVPPKALHSCTCTWANHPSWGVIRTSTSYNLKLFASPWYFWIKIHETCNSAILAFFHSLAGNVAFLDVVRSWFWRHIFMSSRHVGPPHPTCRWHHVMSGSFFPCRMSCRCLIADMSW